MNISNIGSASMFLNGSSSLSKVEVAMLSKALNSNEIAGEGLIAMIDSAAMERSVNPSVGSNIDISI